MKRVATMLATLLAAGALTGRNDSANNAAEPTPEPVNTITTEAAETSEADGEERAGSEPAADGIAFVDKDIEDVTTQEIVVHSLVSSSSGDAFLTWREEQRNYCASYG